MVATACERGLDVVQGDALHYLESLPDGSLGGLMAAQVVEHLTPPYLTRLLGTASEAQVRGAADRRNHQPRVLAGVLQQLYPRLHARPAGSSGDAPVLAAGQRLRPRDPPVQPAVPEHMKMQPVDVAALAAVGGEAAAVAQMARVVNANAAILNNLLFTYFDYAAIGYRS
jgi:hypothetical protein